MKFEQENKMAQLNSFLVFNGNCREAMQFYQKCFEGKLSLNTVRGSPTAAQMPPEMQDKILFASLIGDTITLMGSDMVDAAGYQHGNTLSLCLVCQSKEEIERLFANLSEGGLIRSSLKKEFFGTFGAVIDKYGFNWMFMYGLTQ
jgi:PhnB protein